MRTLALSDEILMKVDKAARYIGGEVNSVMKDKNDVDIRFAMCFPDVYEIGMSNLGMMILYNMFNEREDVWCERVFSPWMDLDEIMREEHIPLFALESQESVKEFDFLGITLGYEMCYTNVLQVLDLSYQPLGTGTCSCNSRYSRSGSEILSYPDNDSSVCTGRCNCVCICIDRNDRYEAGCFC